MGAVQLGQVPRVPGEVPGRDPGSHERSGAGGTGVVSLGSWGWWGQVEFKALSINLCALPLTDCLTSDKSLKLLEFQLLQL